MDQREPERGPDHDGGGSAPSADAGREELMALLRLVPVLGLTVAAGIAAGLLLGLEMDRRLPLHGGGTIAGLLLGLGLSFFWAYRHIVRHLERFAPKRHDRHESNP